MVTQWPSVNIGDTDENADWIKTPENRASEAAIHEELARQLEASEDQPEPEANPNG